MLLHEINKTVLYFCCPVTLFQTVSLTLKIIKIDFRNLFNLFTNIILLQISYYVTAVINRVFDFVFLIILWNVYTSSLILFQNLNISILIFISNLMYIKHILILVGFKDKDHIVLPILDVILMQMDLWASKSDCLWSHIHEHCIFQIWLRSAIIFSVHKDMIIVYISLQIVLLLAKNINTKMSLLVSWNIRRWFFLITLTLWTF